MYSFVCFVSFYSMIFAHAFLISDLICNAIALWHSFAFSMSIFIDFATLKRFYMRYLFLFSFQEYFNTTQRILLSFIHCIESTTIAKILSVYWTKRQEVLSTPSDVLACLIVCYDNNIYIIYIRILCTWGGWTVKAKALIKLSLWTFAVYVSTRCRDIPS